ncbi:MAG: fibronectin type III domain-containing protein [Candidatus Vogelbacteria bacterium]|nr:fibronectin type III domain-containing protein [Candidatus Vogelbacteria bacterium]
MDFRIYRRVLLFFTILTFLLFNFTSVSAVLVPGPLTITSGPIVSFPPNSRGVAKIFWTTNIESDSQVSYLFNGLDTSRPDVIRSWDNPNLDIRVANEDGVDNNGVFHGKKIHEVTLTGLEPSSKFYDSTKPRSVNNFKAYYQFRVKSVDYREDSTTYGADVESSTYLFILPPPSPSFILTDVASTVNDETGVDIRWSTPNYITTRNTVYYSTYQDFSTSTKSGSTHSIADGTTKRAENFINRSYAEIRNLLAGTTYYYIVESANDLGGTAQIITPRSFKTRMPQIMITGGPVVANTVNIAGKGEANIGWTTSISSRSIVYYSKAPFQTYYSEDKTKAPYDNISTIPAVGVSRIESGSDGNKHSVKLSGLDPSATYYFRVVSSYPDGTDGSGVIATQESFVTRKADGSGGVDLSITNLSKGAVLITREPVSLSTSYFKNVRDKIFSYFKMSNMAAVSISASSYPACSGAAAKLICTVAVFPAGQSSIKATDNTALAGAYIYKIYLAGASVPSAEISVIVTGSPVTPAPLPVAINTPTNLALLGPASATSTKFSWTSSGSGLRYAVYRTGGFNADGSVATIPVNSNIFTTNPPRCFESMLAPCFAGVTSASNYIDTKIASSTYYSYRIVASNGTSSSSPSTNLFASTFALGSDANAGSGGTDGGSDTVALETRIFGEQIDISRPGRFFVRNGTKRILFFLVHVGLDSTSFRPVYNPKDYLKIKLGDDGIISRYFKEVSHGKLKMLFNIYGDWVNFTISNERRSFLLANQSQCSQFLENSILKFISDNKVDVSNYDEIHLSHDFDCGASGVSSIIDGRTISGKKVSFNLSTDRVYPEFSPRNFFDGLLIHELAHSLGLLAHAGSCTNIDPPASLNECSSAGHYLEYGNENDVLGKGFGVAYFNGIIQRLLGYLTPEESTVRIIQPGIFKIRPLESDFGTRSLDLSFGSDNYYVLEFRRPMGFDAGFSERVGGDKNGGLFIYLKEDSDSNSLKNIIITNPLGSASVADGSVHSPLKVGSDIRLNYGFKLTNINEGQDYSIVGYDHPAYNCTVNAPQILWNMQPTLYVGRSNLVSFELFDSDSTKCKPRDFNVSISGLPDGWSGVLRDVDNKELSPGNGRNVNLLVNIPETTIEGRYTIGININSVRVNRTFVVSRGGFYLDSAYDRLVKGVPHTIKWSKGPVINSLVNIDLIDQNGSSKRIFDSIPNSGSQPWSIETNGNIKEGLYGVRISCVKSSSSGYCKDFYDGVYRTEDLGVIKIERLSIVSVSPTTAPANTALDLTIKGSGFVAGVTSLYFGGRVILPADISVSADGNQLTTTIPVDTSSSALGVSPSSIKTIVVSNGGNNTVNTTITLSGGSVPQAGVPLTSPKKPSKPIVLGYQVASDYKLLDKIDWNKSIEDWGDISGVEVSRSTKPDVVDNPSEGCNTSNSLALHVKGCVFEFSSKYGRTGITRIDRNVAYYYRVRTFKTITKQFPADSGKLYSAWSDYNISKDSVSVESFDLVQNGTKISELNGVYAIPDNTKNFQAVIKLKNSGTVEWKPIGHSLFDIVQSDLADKSQWSKDNVNMYDLSDIVNPGETVSFTVNLIPGGRVGAYPIGWGVLVWPSLDLLPQNDVVKKTVRLASPVLDIDYNVSSTDILLNKKYLENKDIISRSILKVNLLSEISKPEKINFETSNISVTPSTVHITVENSGSTCFTSSVSRKGVFMCVAKIKVPKDVNSGKYTIKIPVSIGGVTREAIVKVIIRGR